MTTQTLDRTDRTIARSAGAAPNSPLGRAKDLLLSKRNEHRGRVPVIVWAAFFRLVVIVADYLLVSVTAMVAIPTLAAWLHQQSGADKGDLSADGTIAMWLMPLLFVVILLAAGEIAVMRGLWRWATRMIQRSRDGRPTDVEPEKEHGRRPAVRASNQSQKTNRKRGK